MRAFIMDEHRRLGVADVPEPEKREDNILVRVKSASICGTDMRTFLKGNQKITPPRTLGHEFAGDIVYVGAKAAAYGWKEGDQY